jgi:hypothetical protein
LARVQIPPVEDEKRHDQSRRTVTFIIEALEGATAEPIRLEEPFYMCRISD